VTLAGVAIASLLVTALINALELSFNERVATDEALLTLVRSQEEQCAAVVIQSIYWRWKMRRGQEGAAARAEVMSGDDDERRENHGVLASNYANYLADFRKIKYRRVQMDIDLIARNVQDSLAVETEGGVKSTGLKTDQNGAGIGSIGELATKMAADNAEMLTRLKQMEREQAEMRQAQSSLREHVSELHASADSNAQSRHAEQQSHVSSSGSSLLNDMLQRLSAQGPMLASLEAESRARDESSKQRDARLAQIYDAVVRSRLTSPTVSSKAKSKARPPTLSRASSTFK
jgi:hypothetical protein